MIGTGLGVVAAGALDYGMVSHLIREGSRDDLGGSIGTPFELVTTSLATVVVYTLMGIAWGKHTTRRVLVAALYGLVFAWLAHYVSQGMDEDASLWTQLRLVGLKTAVYTMPGLLLCVFEHWLVFWVKLTWKYHVAARIVAEADQLLANQRAIEQDKEAVQGGHYLADLVDQAMRCSLDKAHGVYTGQHEAAVTVQNDRCTDEMDKNHAEMQRLKSERCLEAVERLQHQPVAPCLLLGLGLALGLAGCSTEAAPVSREEILTFPRI